MRWNDASEPPPPDTDVLVYIDLSFQTEDGEYVPGFVYDVTYWDGDLWQSLYTAGRVTHWMELPPVPAS